MAIITRASKGSALTHNELDTNFTDLRDGINLMIPKAKGYGIKIDSLGTPTFGWHDLTSQLHITDIADPNAPNYEYYLGSIKQWKFAANDEGQIRFHIPHDYAIGTDIFIHSHWSHISPYVTGGTVTFGYELIYAKGHNQAAFSAPVIVSEVQTVSVIPYQHMICESIASTAGGGYGLLNTTDIEVDGLILGRVYLISNNITVSSGPVPDIFIHEVDIHYQSTGVTTKNRMPDFWT